MGKKKCVVSVKKYVRDDETPVRKHIRRCPKRGITKKKSEEMSEKGTKHLPLKCNPKQGCTFCKNGWTVFGIKYACLKKDRVAYPSEMDGNCNDFEERLISDQEEENNV